MNDRTKISLGLAITLIGGGAAWMTSIALQTAANAKMLQAMEAKQNRYHENVQFIAKDLAVIRTQVEFIAEFYEKRDH